MTKTLVLVTLLYLTVTVQYEYKTSTTLSARPVSEQVQSLLQETRSKGLLDFSSCLFRRISPDVDPPLDYMMSYYVYVLSDSIHLDSALSDVGDVDCCRLIEPDFHMFSNPKVYNPLSTVITAFYTNNSNNQGYVKYGMGRFRQSEQSVCVYQLCEVRIMALCFTFQTDDVETENGPSNDCKSQHSLVVNDVLPHQPIICCINPSIMSTVQYMFAADLLLDQNTMLYYHVKHSRINPPSIPITFQMKQCKCRLILIILLSGDVATNPGPGCERYKCSVCERHVNKNHRFLKCTECNKWTHKKCSNLQDSVYKQYKNNETSSFLCKPCLDSTISTNISLHYDCNEQPSTTKPYIDSLNPTNNMECSPNTNNNDSTHQVKTILVDNDDQPHVDSLLNISDRSFMIDSFNSPDNSVIDDLLYSDHENNTEANDDYLEELKLLRKSNAKRPLIAHLNINSLKNKFTEIHEILGQSLVDMLVLAETKLDSSFNNNIYSFTGFKMERKDRDRYGGGIIVYVRDDLPFRRRKDLECEHLESICFELALNKRKWGILAVYKPPNTKNELFSTDLSKTLDKMFVKYNNILTIGDLNFDLNKKDKCKPLSQLCDNYNLTNVIKGSTCHMKNSEPSSIDVILTNTTNLICNTINVDIGVSDCHNFIATTIREQCNESKVKYANFRSYKHFNEDNFNQDILKIPFHSYHNHDIDGVYGSTEMLLTEVINKHAPMKKKKIKKESPPFMNGDLRKSIYKKKQLRNAYFKCRTNENWNAYKYQRNLVTNLKRKSMQIYFEERCSEGPKSRHFWPTIKPFLSSKNVHKSESGIILNENNAILTKPDEVCNVLNDFYVNIANNIGIKSSVPVNSDHPSVQAIRERHHFAETFEFKPVSTNYIRKQLKNLNPKKATGVDNIPPKILRAGATSLAIPLTKLVNQTLISGKFPDSLKLAQVTPIYKKEDPFQKKNYRPVSILPTISKIFERTISDQLINYFENIFHDFLSAFRPKFGCQTSLLRLVEDWKRALDRHEYVAAVLMDLSKAFDCLPHNLIIEKLKAYGLSDHSAGLMSDYLSNRKQRVKINESISEWKQIKKGVPQGSILGPLIFNIFINDIFYFINKATLSNYADDNTLSHNHTDVQVLKQTLELESSTLIRWFEDNQMQANPDKFQAISIGKATTEKLTSFHIEGFDLDCEESVKLLGVEIDSLLNFDKHVTDICKKVAKQINVLSRLSKFLNQDTRILIYKCFIKSNFNYCPLVWHFCSKQNTEKMEKLQFRALKFVYNDFNSSYKDLLDRINMPTLYIGRIKQIATEVFKCLNNISPKYIQELVSKRSTDHYSFRYVNSIDIPRVNTATYGKKSFRFEAAQVWNSLPNELRSATDIDVFRELIKTWSGPKCKCSMCA